ncbi:hypothetical protein [Agrobacterium pusense]|uniref:hypothetical protein n=1 Tax=Agrobacterium pusense TaxID=648995 RepID=UPI0011B23E1D|nr:hypothetical protein [Agrobacterium pusense]
MIAKAQQQDDGKWYVMPAHVGLYGVPFAKDKACIIVDAINAAFVSGQNDVRSSLRRLIGAAAIEDQP